MSLRVLERDEAWRGEVRLSGALLVPPGRRLLLLAGCRVVAADARARLVVEGALEARGALLRPVTLAVPVLAGGAVAPSRCVVSGPGKTGLELRGPGHRLERVTLTGWDTGLAHAEGDVTASGLEARGNATAVHVGPGGRFGWDGGGARDGRVGLQVEGGAARVRGLRFERLATGVFVRVGEADVDGLDYRGSTGPAVGVHGDGFARARGVSAPGGEALVVETGHAHLLGPCRGAVRVGAAARLCAAPGAVAAAPYGRARRFVQLTAAFLSSPYRAAAAAAVALFAAWAGRLPGLRGAWAHRSWAAGGWAPGYSDVDLALSVASPADEAPLAAAQDAFARARRFFPALGELSLAEEADWAAGAAAGLPRAAEWRRGGARLLAGRLPPAPTPTASAARLGARLEAAVAHSRLMRTCFSPGLPGDALRREAAKDALDVLRYLSPEGLAGAALSRVEYRASPLWAERLAELGGERPHEAACRLAAALARRLDEGGESGDAGTAPSSAAPGEDVELARRDLAGGLRGALFDSLHHRYAVLEPDLPEESLAACLAAWARRAAACGARGALPVLLYPAGWAAWRASAYQDFPASLALAPARAEETAGAAFPGASRRAWGRWRAPRPAEPDAAAALAQAAANLRAVRRLLARDARRDEASRHLLLTRAAALALTRRGAPAPDFDLDAALAALAPLAPAPADGLRRAAAGDWSRFDAAFEELLPAAAPERAPQEAVA